MEIEEFPRCLNTIGRVDSICYGPWGIYTTQALFIVSSKTIVQNQQGDSYTEPSRALSQSGAMQGSSITVNSEEPTAEPEHF